MATLTNIAAQACANAFGSLADGGNLIIYGGTPPANASASLAGNSVLAELALSPTAFGAATDANPGAVISANAITDDSSANATGTATFFRLTNSSGAVILQGSVAQSGAELNLSSTSITVGDVVRVTSMNITFPEA